MSKVKIIVTGALALGVAIVSQFEGLRTKAYLDPVGIPTICYGSTAGVKLGQTRTVEECKELLAGELGKSMAEVDRLVKVPLPDTRKAALGSFVYNVGETAFARSSMLRKLNAGDWRGACNELPRWSYAKGVQLPGLVKRRAAERELCLRN